MEVVCGQIGYTPDTFWNMTDRETHFTILGYSSKREREYQIAMESGRLAGFLAVSPYLKKGATPQSTYPFAWEKDRKRAVITKSEDTLKISDSGNISGTFSAPADPARPSTIHADPAAVAQMMKLRELRRKK